MDKLNRKFRRFGIENLMIYITATMLVVYVMEAILKIPISLYIGLDRTMLFQGQVWRLITFVFQPPGVSSPIWLIFSLYFYYFIGSSLEDVWGASQFTLYYVFGIVGAIIAALISGGGNNMYLNLSLFLAFAQLFPDYQILLFFLIPIKIKYLAYLDWALFFFAFVGGTFVDRMAIVFSLLNFFLFFGPGIVGKIRNNMRYSKTRKSFRKQMQQNKDMWGR